MKVMERVLETIIRTQVDIDSIQSGFMLESGIFILQQIGKVPWETKRALLR